MTTATNPLHYRRFIEAKATGQRVRLGVDGWRLQGERTGIWRYLANLVSRWDSDAVDGRFAGITVYSPRPLDGHVRLPDGVSQRVLKPAARMLVWDNVRLGPAAGDEVLFCPSYTRPVVARGATVAAIHDVIPLMRPELFGRSQRLFYNRLYGWSARHSTLVITSTFAARDDIVRVWELPAERVRVVPLAAEERFHEPVDPSLVAAARDSRIGSPYFLFVGKTAGRRRVPTLVESFAAFRRETRAPHRLLLVGPEPSEDVTAAVARFGLTAEVVHAGFVPDDELAALYAGAAGLVCPSAHETVSLPIMEAQAAGCPVICLDSPGTREITRGAAVFLDRLDVSALAAALGRLAGDRSGNEALAAAGRSSAARFSWERTARETLAVLAEAAGLGTGEPAGAGAASRPQ